MTVNLNTQPLRYDQRRVRYVPDHTFDCGHCQTPLEAFSEVMFVPASPWHQPGKGTLLCMRCAKLWWDAEHAAMEASY